MTEDKPFWPCLCWGEIKASPPHFWLTPPSVNVEGSLFSPRSSDLPRSRWTPPASSFFIKNFYLFIFPPSSYLLFKRWFGLISLNLLTRSFCWLLCVTQRGSSSAAACTLYPKNVGKRKKAARALLPAGPSKRHSFYTRTLLLFSALECVTTPNVTWKTSNKKPITGLVFLWVVKRRYKWALMLLNYVQTIIFTNLLTFFY